MSMHFKLYILLICSVYTRISTSQSLYFGADLSYVNEMEDCGAIYKENAIEKDVYQIFADHGCNLVRLRLWHTPSWYDNLNHGLRYSDLDDVKKSIDRAKDQQMDVLLNFHLSDNWADPSKQIIPEAWMPVVDNLPLLQDSLYNYISSTLNKLEKVNLLPELVQIGNETNRGILLSPQANQEWTLEWDRNAALFNTAIKAVRDFSDSSNHPIKVVLHVAGPSDTKWWINEFIAHGVRDFDVIGISYYWAWHKPTTIEETGTVIADLKNAYPNREVIIVETGYLWTEDYADNANNIITEKHPDYLPVSAETQKQWLIDLTTEVLANGGSGVVYWEPAWVSTPCWNQWDQGSHQEHATFFDFNHDLLLPGGIEWMEHDYGLSTTKTVETGSSQPEIHLTNEGLRLKFGGNRKHDKWVLSDTLGKNVYQGEILSSSRLYDIPLQAVHSGIYIFSIYRKDKLLVSRKITWHQ